MFGEFGKVLVDHVESGLKHGVEDRSDLRHEDGLDVSFDAGTMSDPNTLQLTAKRTYSEPGHNGRNDIQHLGVPSRRHVLVVITQDGVKEPRDEVPVDTLQILGFADKCLDKLEYFLLDRSEGTDLGGLCSDETYTVSSGSPPQPILLLTRMRGTDPALRPEPR